MKPSRIHIPLLTVLLWGSCLPAFAQALPESYHLTWTTQSKNAGESMPCGGGDIGLNVWVESGDLLFYIARSGTFDEHNALLKLGRVRVRLSPNPLKGQEFSQQLHLQDGTVRINGRDGRLSASIKVWVDVFQPVVHLTIQTEGATTAEAHYESWRYKERLNTGKANNGNSYKWAPRGEVITYPDSVAFVGNGVQFFHRNREHTVFDVTVSQQGLDTVKGELYNPLKFLTFGGRLEGRGMIAGGTGSGIYLDTDYKSWVLRSGSPSRQHALDLYLHTRQAPELRQWKEELEDLIHHSKTIRNPQARNQQWWKAFWERSYILIDNGNGSDSSQPWQAGRNYQLFRYMLAANARGEYPTKFNGGLFTYDPSLTDSNLKFTPDFRNWGGGTHTAQNQRLVHFPLLKSGDFDLLQPQLRFYLRLQKNAELRSRVYWNHEGACFTEQLENFGLPNPAEYGWKRPAYFDKGLEYNAWLEYEWDTVLEFCLMMLEEQRYTRKDIRASLPFIRSCLQFFDKHYQYRARQRGAKTFDGNGQLVLYPGSGAETYKMALNASSTIAALTTITERLLELPGSYLSQADRASLDSFRRRIPPISFTSIDGHKTIAPARSWERINNTESPQLYPVYPWGIYGIGKPDLEVARNTYLHDSNAIKFRSHLSWKQDNIFAARLGLTEEAAKWTVRKLQNSGRRFPAFWGPGYDWTPDHNWGGSGMIGLQEMLMQVDGEKIYLLPAWPKTWDVHFKLHAPFATTVEAVVRNGEVKTLLVVPEHRKKDIIIMNQ